MGSTCGAWKPAGGGGGGGGRQAGEVSEKTTNTAGDAPRAAPRNVPSGSPKRDAGLLQTARSTCRMVRRRVRSRATPPHPHAPPYSLLPWPCPWPCPPPPRRTAVAAMRATRVIRILGADGGGRSSSRCRRGCRATTNECRALGRATRGRARGWGETQGRVRVGGTPKAGWCEGYACGAAHWPWLPRRDRMFLHGAPMFRQPIRFKPPSLATHRKELHRSSRVRRTSLTRHPLSTCGVCSCRPTRQSSAPPWFARPTPP